MKIQIRTIVLLFALCVASGGAAESQQKRVFVSSEDTIVDWWKELLPKEDTSAYLWDHFSQDPAVQGFSNLTTDGWAENYDTFAKALVEKARKRKMEASSLEKVLAHILDKRGGLVLLPVAAYSGKVGSADCWIIVCKWEIEPRLSKPIMTKDGPRFTFKESGLGHVRMWAYDQKSIEVVAFNTCL